MATVIKITDHAAYQSQRVAEDDSQLPAIPHGLCHCGCGEKTPLARQSDTGRGYVRGEPLLFIRGHSSGGTGYWDRVRRITEDRKTDEARINRNNWQRALEGDLRALRDYVYQHQFIVWKPGEQAQEVHLTTTSSCTCSRFKLSDACEHTTFVQKLEAANQLPGLETPVAAKEVTP